MAANIKTSHYLEDIQGYKTLCIDNEQNDNLAQTLELIIQNVQFAMLCVGETETRHQT